MITHEIVGDDMQAIVVSMAAGDEIRAGAGAMTFMTDGIEMDAHAGRPHGGAHAEAAGRGKPVPGKEEVRRGDLGGTLGALGDLIGGDR